MKALRCNYRLLLLGAVSGLLLAGCSSQMVQSGNDDNTGQMAERASGSRGAGTLYTDLAIAYYKRGQLAVALQQTRKALQVEPDSAQAHNIMALIYDRLEDRVQAERHFKEAIDIEPRNSYIRNAYAASLCQQDRYSEANQQFQAALKNPLYKTPEVALSNAGICAERAGDGALAEEYFRRALRFNPLFPLALVKMAGISLDKRQYEQAQSYLSRYQKVAPHSAESLWIGIRVERVLGDENALASYRLKLKGRYPDSNEAKLLMESEQR